MIKTVLLTAFLLSTGLLLSTGPGGVSNGLQIWFAADSLSLSDNNNVVTWHDESGNDNHATQNAEDNRPVFKTNIINNKPAVVFNGSNQFLNFNGNVIAGSDYTIIAVLKRTNSKSGNYILGGTTEAANRNLHVGWRSSGVFTHAHYSNDYNVPTATYSASGEPAIITTLRHSNSSGKDLFSNGGLRGMNLLSGRTTHLTDWDGAAIGKYLANYLQGWVAELIIYNRHLPENERQDVEEYLGNKYAITVSTTENQGYYTGIELVSVSDGSPNQSKTSGGLTIDGSFIANSSNFRFGNSNEEGLINEGNPNPEPYQNFLRLKREWYAQVSGSLNTVFNFDLDNCGLGVDVPVGEQYRLLFRDDKKETYTLYSIEPTIVGSVVSFVVNPRVANVHNGFYTLATLDIVLCEARLWLAADSLSLNNDDQVSIWTDLSGRDNHAIQSEAGYQPLFKTNVINGKPAVVFGGIDQFLNINGNIIANTDYSIIAVVKRASDKNNHFFLGGSGAGVGFSNVNLHAGWRDNSTFTHAQYNNDYNVRVNGYNALTEEAVIVTLRQSDVSGKDLFVNGGLRGMNLNTSAGFRTAHLSSWADAAIGRYAGLIPNIFFEGWVAELMIFDRSITDEERIEEEERLSTKYGITVHSTTNRGYYSEIFDLTVTGSKNTESQSSGGLIIDGTYISGGTSRIRSGNNDAVGQTNTNNPNTDTYPHFMRLNREWYLGVSGSLNSVFNFDLDDLGLETLNPSGDEYRLLFRNNLKDDLTVISALPSINGSVISFIVNPRTEVTHNGFYTLGTLDSNVSTLPVELSAFTVAVTAEMFVQLNWTAETETNMLGYNIYRGENDNLADAVRVNFMVIAAHNTSMAKSYHYVDRDVDHGKTYFYWLQSNDLNLTHQFHGPISVLVEDTGEEGSGIELPIYTELIGAYPNPFNPGTHLSFSLEEKSRVSITVYNLKGQLIRELLNEEEFPRARKHSVYWDGRNENGSPVASGVYLYLMQTDKDYRQSRKMILMK